MSSIRGFDNLHKRDVFELVRSVAYERKDVILAMTINRLNFEHIETFVREVSMWHGGGVVFSFSTPYVGDQQPFYLKDEQKEQTVQRLLRLKDVYGDFIVMSRRALELLRPCEVSRWSPQCPTWAAKSIRSDGIPIERCIFGPKADCSRCGCNISTSMVALGEGDRETARMLSLPMRLATAAAPHESIVASSQPRRGDCSSNP